MISLLQNRMPHPALRKIFKLIDLPSEGSFDELVEQAQTHLLRTKKTERWEAIGQFPYEPHKEELLTYLDELGFIKDQPPAISIYDYIIIFVFVSIDVKSHIEYIAPFILENKITAKQVVILTSELPIPAELKKPYATEAEMMHAIVGNSVLARYPISSVSVPMLFRNNKVQRPTTDDTVIAWLDTQPMPGYCLAVSAQPFIYRQTCILKTLLPEAFKCFPTGPASPEISLKIYMDELARAMYQEQKFAKKYC
jgi:hypothetical protein